ncbi:hypothetical protein, partial [uncultured Arenimonas sp.]|uniref:phage head spike fiber domain-containing protein n=1 Tax=uncultured Arenimonas sp. TaxID=546226 RepID=UPI0030DAFA6D
MLALSAPMRRGALATAIGETYRDIVKDGVLAPFVTFTRASTATRYNSAGLLETVAANAPRLDYDPASETRENLLTYSKNIDNSSWGKVRCSASASGEFWRITEDTTAAASHGITKTAIPAAVGTVATVSLKVKKSSARNFGFWVGSNAGNPTDGYRKVINLSTGTVSDGVVNGTGMTEVGTAVVEYDAETWLVSTTMQIGSGGTGFGLYLCIVSGTTVASMFYTGDGISSVEIAGPQLEYGHAATDYIPTGVLERGADIFTDESVSFVGASSRVSPGVYRILSDGTYSLANLTTSLVPGRSYEAQYTIDSVAVVGNGIATEPVLPVTPPATVGTHRVQFTATTGNFGLKRAS